jgi:hypothetical protein
MSNQAYGFKKDSRFAKHNDIADIYNQFLERADQVEEFDDDEEVAAAEIMWGKEPLTVNLLTVNSCIKVCLDLQADKSPVVVKGPFFPRVVNPRYRIRGTMCNARIQSSKAR